MPEALTLDSANGTAPAKAFDDTLKGISALLDQLKADHEQRVVSLEKRIHQQNELLKQAAGGQSITSLAVAEPAARPAQTSQEKGKESDATNAEQVQVSSKWEALPTQGKPNFVLKGEWIKVVEAETFFRNVNDQLGNKSMVAMRTRSTIHREEGALEDGELVAETPMHLQKAARDQGCCLRFFFIDPSSMYRMGWDLSGMFLIAYDMIGIPIQIGFEPEPMWLTTGMGWLTLVFWTVDMPASCMTGFYKDGNLITSHFQIIKGYVKFWFWIDCIIVVPDWIMKFQGGGSSPAGLARMFRIARSLRILRLLRLLKLKKLSAIIYDSLDSEFMFLVFGLFQLIGIILVLTHLVGCGFYFVGRMTIGQYDKNWIQDVGLTPVDKTGLDWKYLTSLHWSITQFTPASMDIFATNVPERLYSVVILYIALVALSSFIGSISASVTQIRNMSADANKSLWLLRRYLKQKQISQDLTNRILSYMDFQMMAKSNAVAEGQVKLLGQLSDSLKSEMQFEMTNKFIKNHPLFLYMNGHEEFTKTMHSLCATGFKGGAVAEKEALFYLGDQGSFMFFVKSGSLEYKLPNDAMLEGTLKSKNWVSEGVLWTQWTHRGNLYAVEPSDVLKLAPKTFSDVMHMHPKPAYLGKHYGTNFVNYLNRQDVRDLTDVVFDAEVWTNVVHESDQFQLRKDISKAEGLGADQEKEANAKA